jgi:hypothetical protein
MNWKGSERKPRCLILKYYHNTFLEGLKKTTNISKYGRSPSISKMDVECVTYSDVGWIRSKGRIQW